MKTTDNPKIELQIGIYSLTYSGGKTILTTNDDGDELEVPIEYLEECLDEYFGDYL